MRVNWSRSTIESIRQAMEIERARNEWTMNEWQLTMTTDDLKSNQIEMVTYARTMIAFYFALICSCQTMRERYSKWRDQKCFKIRSAQAEDVRHEKHARRFPSALVFFHRFHCIWCKWAGSCSVSLWKNTLRNDPLSRWHELWLCDALSRNVTIFRKRKTKQQTLNDYIIFSGCHCMRRTYADANLKIATQTDMIFSHVSYLYLELSLAPHLCTAYESVKWTKIKWNAFSNEWVSSVLCCWHVATIKSKSNGDKSEALDFLRKIEIYVKDTANVEWIFLQVHISRIFLIW